MSNSLQRLRARQNARYDRPQPILLALVPSVLALAFALFVARIPKGRDHNTAVDITLAVFIVLMVIDGVLVWSWTRRHRLATARTSSPTWKVLHLRLPARYARLAPVGVAVFGFLAVISTINWIEGLADGNLSAAISLVVFIAVYGALFALCAEASVRLFRYRRR